MVKERCERCGHEFDESEHKDMGRRGSEVFEVEHYVENTVGYLQGIIKDEVKLRGLEKDEEKVNRFLDRLEKEAIIPEEKLKPRRVCKACYGSKGFHEEERDWLELQEARSIYKWMEKECKKGNIVDELILENYKSGEIDVLEGAYTYKENQTKRTKG